MPSRLLLLARQAIWFLSAQIDKRLGKSKKLHVYSQELSNPSSEGCLYNRWISEYFCDSLLNESGGPKLENFKLIISTNKLAMKLNAIAGVVGGIIDKEEERYGLNAFFAC